MQMNSFKIWYWVILQHVFISFFFDENDINYTNIIQYFIMHRLGLCIKLNGFVANMLYA